MKRGGVYIFNYLWGHEAARGEESGRKSRRVCLLIRHREHLYLFPLSSKVPVPHSPGQKRIYVVVPEIECRRIGLPAGSTSHLILDDYNRLHVDHLYDFEGLEPVGAFSLKFLARAASRFLEAMAAKRPVSGRARS